MTEQLDEGPIILQDVFPIDVGRDEAEDVRAKGQKLEGRILAEAVRMHLDAKLVVVDGKVVFRPGLRRCCREEEESGRLPTQRPDPPPEALDLLHSSRNCRAALRLSAEFTEARRHGAKAGGDELLLSSGRPRSTHLEHPGASMRLRAACPFSVPPCLRALRG